MGKALFIAEKPSVAQEFANALGIKGARRNGYVESPDAVVTWCVGHLVTMSYPDAYDPALKRWSFAMLPFLPKQYKYEVIPGVKDQFTIVSTLLNRADVDCIYVCTDSGREGEYIYRLVAQMAGVQGKQQKRVWIDSQTEEEIRRGIREAKDLSAYDNLSSAAYLRAKEDYLMGINFSRALTLRYGSMVSSCLQTNVKAISVGRVMTCVLGMVVRREREIRAFVKTPFYRVVNIQLLAGESFEGEWRAVEGSRYFQSPRLYKENGFSNREDAEKLIQEIKAAFPLVPLSEVVGVSVAKEVPEEQKVQVGQQAPETQKEQEGQQALEKQEVPEGQQGSTLVPKLEAIVKEIQRKKENRNPPLLFNLAELQNVCSKLFKISPDETLQIVQDLYEKKLVTYPRTDARVLSTAVAKEIDKNIKGLCNYETCGKEAQGALDLGTYKTIGKSRYTNDKQITDHYAIIPTGQGLGALRSLSQTAQRVYETIVRRFLSIFYPPAVYQRVSLVTRMDTEFFFSSFKVLLEEGYLKVATNSFAKKQMGAAPSKDADDEQEMDADDTLLAALAALKKGDVLPVSDLQIKEGETSPPKRYNSGSMILAMENAGQLIEDEELRAQIKGSGIGTSATRAEILKKLFTIGYLDLNKKTQVIAPTLCGELIYDVVNSCIRSLLNPELTASWEKGLTYVAEGSITSEEYMGKLEAFVTKWTKQVEASHDYLVLQKMFAEIAPYYKKPAAATKAAGSGEKTSRSRRSTETKKPTNK